MAGPDIVARLQLRAEQFSSEGGRAFVEMATRARSTSADIRQTFGTDLAAVGKLAQQALTLPRTSGGSLDLSGEIASLRQAAAAADTRSVAALEMRNAMQSAAFATEASREAALRDADAAMVDSRAAEQQANAIRQRITQLEAYQVELNRVSSSTVMHTRAANDNRVSAEQQRQATIQLGQQLQDFSVQVVSGQSVATAFAQQVGQASFALQNMGGKLAGVASFLTSGWGIAATIGLTVLAPLVAKIFEGNDALAEAVKKLKDEEKQSGITRDARALFAKTEEGVTAAIDDGYEASKKLVGLQKTSAEQALIDARSNLTIAQTIRQKTEAELDYAAALLESAKARSMLGGERSDVATQAVASREEQLAAIQKRRLANSLDIARAEVTVNNALIAQERAQAKLAQDPVARVRAEWDAKIAALDDEQMRQGTITAEYRARSRELERQKTLAVEAEEARQAAAKRQPKRDSELATPASIAKLLRDSLGGVNITATTNGKHVAGSDHYRGAAIDFVPKGGMASISKDQIRDAFEKAGVSIRRNAGGVEQLFGPGDKGHADHFHVAWEKGKLAVDNYRASVRETNKATHDAEEAQKKLEASFDQILGKFDPAADAARKYREEIEAIAELAANKKITREQQFDYMAAAKRDYTAAQSTNSEQLLRDTFGDAQVTAALADFDTGVAAGVEILKDGVDDAVTTFGDGLRNAVGGAMDLLGIRINGPLRGLLQPGGIEGEANDIARSLTEGLRNSNLNISPASIEKLSSTLGSALAGASYGQIGGSVFASITGGKQNQLGSALGGVAGKVAGDALGKTIASTVSGTLGKTLGGAAGPLGAIAGGIVGSVIGGLFKKTVKGSAGISTGDGTISAGSASGTNATVKGQAGTLAGSVASGLQSIADQLGAVISGSSNVQIGVYKDKLRVSTNGTPIGGKGSVGAQTFTDETAAIKYAIQDALQDGVLSGISAASLKILKSGQDLERALSKALMIEAVPKDLKAMLDPVGAAIDELNSKFQKTVDALKEGGATAEQMAQAQQLYDLQLAQVKNSTASASQGLKDFLASMKIGSNSPYSLRDQEQAAKAALAPYLSQIAAGQSIDQGKYQAAAQAYLDIERQLYGSTKAYFDALDAVQAATNKAISTIDNATPIGTSVEAPFAKAAAASAATTATNTQTTNELLDQLSQQAEVTNDLLSRLAIAAGNGTEDFIGTGRNFVAAA